MVIMPGYTAGNNLRPAAIKQSVKRFQDLSHDLGARSSSIIKDGGIADIFNEVAVIEAKNNPSAIAKRLSTLLYGYRKKIINLITHRPQDLNQQLEQIVNEVNARESLKKIHNIGVAPITYVEDYQHRQLAKQNLIEGKLMLQMPFAGAGSRMDNSLTSFGIKLPPEEIRLANNRYLEYSAEDGQDNI